MSTRYDEASEFAIHRYPEQSQEFEFEAPVFVADSFAAFVLGYDQYNDNPYPHSLDELWSDFKELMMA